MVYFLVGAIITAALFFTVNHVKKNNITVAWWQWGITLLGFAYTTLVLAIIIEFLSEGVLRGALVMGNVMGLIAIVWAVLLKRFVFIRHTK